MSAPSQSLPVRPPREEDRPAARSPRRAGRRAAAERAEPAEIPEFSAAEVGLDPSLTIPEVIRLREPFDGVPGVIDTPRGLERAAEQLAAASGPVALDTERASGIRYGQRPFLVQIKRGEGPILLIDPEAFEDLRPINEALAGSEWIIHASTQDLPSLAEVGMSPDALFDTELAGRLLGMPRVSLGVMTEDLLGYRLAKEHSAVDWSQRPLPEPWLAYAALDVELLIPLRDAVAEQLEAHGKMDWALQEFEAIAHPWAEAPRPPRWRRVKGLHQVRQPRQLTALRNLWAQRESLAEAKDIAPKRLLSDSALISAARAMPKTVPALQSIPGFQAKLIRRESVRWIRAIQEAAADPEPEQVSPAHGTPPPAKAWEYRRPLAAQALGEAKQALREKAEQLELPAENLLTPEILRRLIWEHGPLPEPELRAALHEYGARDWQIEQVVGILEPILRSLDAPA